MVKKRGGGQRPPPFSFRTDRAVRSEPALTAAAAARPEARRRKVRCVRSVLRTELTALPCSGFPRATRFAGLARGSPPKILLFYQACTSLPPTRARRSGPRWKMRSKAAKRSFRRQAETKRRVLCDESRRITAAAAARPEAPGWPEPASPGRTGSGCCSWCTPSSRRPRRCRGWWTRRPECSPSSRTGC